MKKPAPPARNFGRTLGPPVISQGVKVKYVIASAIAFLTFFVYLRTLQFDFVWDDEMYVVSNPSISSLNGALLKSAFFAFYSFNWHPLTWMSHALDYAIWGLNPLGHHLTNNILHSVNTFLVVLLVIKLIEAVSDNSRFTIEDSGFTADNSRATLVAAGTTALLFGLHPLHVESVAWISERKDLLCTIFFLPSIIMYIKYADNIPALAERRIYFPNKYYFFSLGFFILALLSKSMAVSLPLVLLILDWYPLKRVLSPRTLLFLAVEKLPFIVLSFILSALTLLAQKAGGAMTLTEFVPFSTRILLSAKSLIVYIWKIILPLNLSPYYPYPRDVSFLSHEYFFPVLLVTTITIVCFAAARKNKLWLGVWSYYVVTLLPVLGIIQVGGQAMADRYTYLPSLGPFLIPGLITAGLYKKVDALKKLRSILGMVSAFGVLAVITLMSYITVHQIGIWKSNIDLWSSVIYMSSTPVTVAYQNRGIAFAKAGELDRAIEDYTKVITLEPLAHFEAYYNRGHAYYRIGQDDRAIEDFSTVIVLNPKYAEAYFNRGIMQFKAGRKDLAVPDFQKACDLGDSKGCRTLQALISR